jgi:metal-responsive CopG/Arc/MetJ family transcriptional regulator
MNTTVKVTLSLPHGLLRFADGLAAREKVSRSKFIAGVLQKLADKEEESLMAEGYLAMAQENKEFAETVMPLVDEVLSARK